MSMRAPVRKSLLRRISWFGGDRRIVGASGLILFFVGVTVFFGYGMLFGLTILIPILLFMGLVWGARAAYRKDPYLVDVAIRQMKYRKFYAPKSHFGVEHPAVKDVVQ